MQYVKYNNDGGYKDESGAWLKMQNVDANDDDIEGRIVWLRGRTGPMSTWPLGEERLSRTELSLLVLRIQMMTKMSIWAIPPLSDTQSFLVCPSSLTVKTYIFFKYYHLVWWWHRQRQDKDKILRCLFRRIQLRYQMGIEIYSMAIPMLIIFAPFL